MGSYNISFVYLNQLYTRQECKIAHHISLGSITRVVVDTFYPIIPIAGRVIPNLVLTVI